MIAAGRYLRTREDVDPKRVGIWGLSYGGVLTGQALARNSDVFVAGVDLAGVHLWGSSLEPDDVAYRSSVVAAVDGWKSPVLLVQGDDDRNVAFSQMVGHGDIPRQVPQACRRRVGHRSTEVMRSARRAVLESRPGQTFSGGLSMTRRPSPLCVRLAFLAAALVASVWLAPRTHAASPAGQSAAGAKASSVDGLWDATIVAGGATVPFRFEISTNGSDATGYFFEGDTKVGSSEGTFVDGTLKLVYDHLNTTLELKLAGDTLAGGYVNNGRANARPQAVQMRRFKPVMADTTAVLQTTGTWEMRRLAEEVSAPRDTRTWHVFLRQSGSEVSGSILRVDGDVGTLVGRWKDGTLTLSHFAGERPTLFEAAANVDGTLNVTLNGNAHYLVVRGSEARAKGIPEPPDPSRYTNVKDPTSPFQFAFPDLTGKIVSNTDAMFKGKVVILAIGGSWCPNCHDEAPFLAELYRDYHAKGLEIVGLMFENDPNPLVARPRVRAFMKRYQIQYPMLIAGTMTGETTIAQRLPQIVNFGAYPTSIYLGRDGKVRSVHAGFASPATGEEHTRLKQELRELTERLLAESATATAAGR